MYFIIKKASNLANVIPDFVLQVKGNPPILAAELQDMCFPLPQSCYITSLPAKCFMYRGYNRQKFVLSLSLALAI